jgi:hypothetical protein
VHLTNWAI